MDIINQIERENMRMDIPVFRPGDTVKVHMRIVEGEKQRIQVFQGSVIRMHRGTTARFPKALAWSVSSPSTPPSLTMWMW